MTNYILERPLAVEEALVVPDEPAGQMPDDVRATLAAQRLYISGASAPAFDERAAVFDFWGSTPYAIGTTSGGETISGGIFGIGDEDNNIEAGGKAMVDLVQWALTNWP